MTVTVDGTHASTLVTAATLEILAAIPLLALAGMVAVAVTVPGVVALGVATLATSSQEFF